MKDLLPVKAKIKKKEQQALCSSKRKVSGTLSGGSACSPSSGSSACGFSEERPWCRHLASARALGSSGRQNDGSNLGKPW